MWPFSFEPFKAEKVMDRREIKNKKKKLNGEREQEP